MPRPLRGEIWMIDIDPTRGHEQAGNRPGLVVSADTFNAGPAGLIIILPLTSQARACGLTCPSSRRKADSANRVSSSAKTCASVALERLSRRLGRVSPATMEAVSTGCESSWSCEWVVLCAARRSRPGPRYA